MSRKDDSIGIFDSGMGGLSVLAESQKLLPHEKFIFIGDNAFAPYGVRSSEQIIQRSELITNKLIDKGCKAIVIACNTATGAAAEILRQKHNIIIIGMEPALKPAYQNHPDKKVLVMATPMTLKSHKFAKLYNQYGENAVLLPCPRLVNFVENGDLDSNDLNEYLKIKFKPFDFKDYGSLVLGCTHYIFVKDAIKKMVPENIDIIDGNRGTVLQLQRLLKQKNLLSQSNLFFIPELISTLDTNDIHNRMKYMLDYIT